MGAGAGFDYLAQAGVQNAENQAAYKQEMANLHFQEQHNEIQSQIDNLTNRLSLATDKNTPDYLKMKSDLANALQAREQLWGGEHHHPRFIELAKRLGHDLHFPIKAPAKPIAIAPPVYGQETIQTPAGETGTVALSSEPEATTYRLVNGRPVPVKVAPVKGAILPSIPIAEGPKISSGPSYEITGPQTPQQIKAQREADAILRGGPLTPAEQEQIKSQQTLADIQGALKNFEILNPEASEDEKQSFLTDIIQKAYGTTLRGNWVNVSGTMNGKPVTLLMDKYTHRYTYQNGEEVPPEFLSMFTPDVKTSAVDENLKAYHDAQAKGYNGSYAQFMAEQTARGRSSVPPTNLEARHVQILTKQAQGIPLTPEETAFEKSYQADLAQKQEFQTKLAQIRETGYGIARQMSPLQVLDTENDNAPTYATFLEMKKNPGRYLPATPGAKALSQENLIHDMVDTSGKLRSAIGEMRTDFPEDMKAKIAVAMGAQNPGSALSMLISSGSLGALTPDQFQVYVYLQQLAENSMSLRSVLSAGQGSDAVRNAILNTLPSLLSPNKKYALMQLDAYDATVARLARGIPKVGLRTDIPGTPNYVPPNKPKQSAMPSGAAKKTYISIRAARAKFPEYRNMTDKQISDEIKAQGFTPEP